MMYPSIVMHKHLRVHTHSRVSVRAAGGREPRRERSTVEEKREQMKEYKNDNDTQLRRERGEGGGWRERERERRGGEAEGAWERRWRRKTSGIHLCFGVCVRSACAFVCTFTCVPCSLCAHVFTCKFPVLSMNAPVRGLRCRLVPRFDNA